MVLGRHKSFFSPTAVKMLEEGDGNPYSKKDPETRRQEILAAITPALVEKIKLVGFSVGNYEVLELIWWFI